jgi:hypothetical protein
MPYISKRSNYYGRKVRQGECTSQQLRQTGYYERNATLHHTPEEVDHVKPAKEKQISRTTSKSNRINKRMSISQFGFHMISSLSVHKLFSCMTEV